MAFVDEFISKSKLEHKITEISSNKKYYMHCDGGSRGNPGIAGSGVVISEDIDNKNVVVEMIIPLGHKTNNEAEWTGLMMGSLLAERLGIKDIEIRLDSELVVNQCNGKYRVKHEALKPYYSNTVDILSKFSNVKVLHVRREYNKYADALSNKAMDLVQL